MALKIFIFLMLVFSTIFYFIPVESLHTSLKKEEAPQLMFENSTMYTLNDIGVTRVVEAANVLKYKNRDEMYLAKLL